MVKNLVLPMEALDPPDLASGYYIDNVTRQRYYYDAATGTWYLCSGLLLIPLAVGPLSWQWQPWTGTSLGTLNVGDKIKVTASWKYVGPKVSGKRIYIILAHYAKGTTPTTQSVDEVASPERGYATIPDFGPYTTATGVTFQQTLTITSDAAGDDLGVYAKFEGASEIYGVEVTYCYYGIGTVIAAAGEFSNFIISNIAKV